MIHCLRLIFGVNISQILDLDAMLRMPNFRNSTVPCREAIFSYIISKSRRGPSRAALTQERVVTGPLMMMDGLMWHFLRVYTKNCSRVVLLQLRGDSWRLSVAARTTFPIHNVSINLYTPALHLEKTGLCTSRVGYVLPAPRL